MNTDKLRELLAKAEANSPVVDSGVMLSRESARAISIELDRLTDELDRLRKDAGRYRTVREFGKMLKVYAYDDADDPASGDWVYDPHPVHVDELADAAIAAQEGRKE